MKHGNSINGVFTAAGMGLFFVCWYFLDIYWATVALMATLSAQILFLLISKQKIETMVWITFLLVIVLGGLTLFFREKSFIQLKTSVVYSCLATAILLSDFVFKKNLIKLLLGEMIDAPAPLFRRLSIAIAIYFYGVAIVNWYIAQYFAESTWVVVKTFVFPAANVVFIILLLLPLLKYIKHE